MKTRLQSIVSVYPESKALSSGSWGFLGSPSLSQVESGRSASRGTGREKEVPGMEGQGREQDVRKECPHSNDWESLDETGTGWPRGGPCGVESGLTIEGCEAH